MKVAYDEVVKKYGSVIGVDRLNLQIRAGEFVVLLGPSGCGKTTTLRMLAGLEMITSGSVYIGESRVNDVAPRDRDVAMVFQSYALYPHMTVRENMAFSLKLAKHPRAEIDRRVGEAADILALSGLLDRFPRQLSGGQRQRVAMGRAIVRKPRVFLFDEPLSNLDANLRAAMRTELKELHQRLRTTSVYVTHDQIEAMTMADQIVVMREGVVEQRGKPLDLYDRPANVFVAAFIGSPAMNLFPGTLRRTSGAVNVELSDGVVVAAPPAIGGADGQSVTLGVRPEHLSVAAGASGLTARIVVVEPTGADTQVFCKFGVARGVVDLTALFRERREFRPGETIVLLPDRERIHVFDAQSGESLGL